MIEDLGLCDRLIEYHAKSNPKPGKIASEKDPLGKVLPEYKDSMDCLLSDEILIREYLDALQKVVNQYVEKFPSCNMYAPWTIIEPVVLQYYAPGGGYKSWHTERAFANHNSARRHLVFMTYLNDVTDQGGTEFMNQKITVSAKKGKTVIWPTDWTYTHRGVVSPTQEKYIITGWYSFTQ